MDQSHHLMQLNPRPHVPMTRGEGSYLWDANGKRYLDMMSGREIERPDSLHAEKRGASTPDLPQSPSGSIVKSTISMRRPASPGS